MPLHVFEERYRELVRERLDFGVVLIRHGSEVGAGRAEDLYEIGTLATLERVEALPDGRFQVLARGVERFRLRSIEHDRPYLTGHVEWLSDPPARARPRLVVLLERYLSAHGVQVTPQLAPGVAGRRGAADRAGPPPGAAGERRPRPGRAGARGRAGQARGHRPPGLVPTPPAAVQLDRYTGTIRPPPA
jgi:hypothetical protein